MTIKKDDYVTNTEFLDYQNHTLEKHETWRHEKLTPTLQDMVLRIEDNKENISSNKAEVDLLKQGLEHMQSDVGEFKDGLMAHMAKEEGDRKDINNKLHTINDTLIRLESLTAKVNKMEDNDKWIVKIIIGAILVAVLNYFLITK